MSKSQHKRVRLTELGRDSYVTQSGIAKLLKAIKEHGIPEHFSRASQYRARKSRCAEMTPYGRLVEPLTLETKVGPVRIAVQNPMAIIHKCLASCSGFEQLMRSAVAAHGTAEPWGLIIYNDGITPQDSTSHHDKRKLIAFYWSFREFGARALSTEEAWFVLATVRTHVLDKYEGGISRFTRECLDSYFFKEGGNNFGTSGMMIPQAAADHPLRALLWSFVADEPALKDFFMNKGHAAMKPCALCANVILYRFYDEAIHSAHFIPTTCMDYDQFVLHSDASIRGILEHLRVQRGALRPDDFAELEICAGFNHHDQGLSLHTHVNVASQTMFDWSHTYLVGGLLDEEVGACMKALIKLKSPTSYKVVGEFVAKFTWPSRIAPNHNKLFDVAAGRSHYNAGAFNSTASEMLSLTPVLALYFSAVALPQGFGSPYVTSIIACIDCVELLQLVKNGIVDPDQLKAAIIRHLELFKAAYGDASIRPKHHYALHLWRMLQHFGTLLSCLVLERFHRQPKKYAMQRHNTTSYEIGLIEEMTICKLVDLQRHWMALGLVSEAAPRGKILDCLRDLYSAEIDSIKVSRRLQTLRGLVTVDDVVFFRDVHAHLCCGEVLLHFTRADETYSIVSVWEPAPVDLNGHVLRFKTTGDPRVLVSSCIEQPLVYSRAADYVTVLVPPLYR